jgi:hypothetical protein
MAYLGQVLEWKGMGITNAEMSSWDRTPFSVQTDDLSPLNKYKEAKQMNRYLVMDDKTSLIVDLVGHRIRGDALFFARTRFQEL